MKRTLLSIFNGLTVYVLTAGLVLAENQPDCTAGKCLPNPLNTTSTVFELVEKVVSWLSFTLGPILVTAMVIIGSFQMLLAKGDPKAFETGKKTVLYTVIGYAILLLGSVLTDIVSDFLGIKK
jgi:hypothetical protein